MTATGSVGLMAIFFVDLLSLLYVSRLGDQTLDLTFQLNPDPKGYTTTTGASTSTLNSPSSFQALGGVGATAQVARAHTVYLRTMQPMTVRLTFVDTTQSVEKFSGLKVLEPMPGNEVTLVELEGSGTFEFCAWGNS